MINSKFRSEEVSRADYEVIRKYDNVFYYIKEVDGTFSLAIGAKEIDGQTDLSAYVTQTDLDNAIAAAITNVYDMIDNAIIASINGGY